MTRLFGVGPWFSIKWCWCETLVEEVIVRSRISGTQWCIGQSRLPWEKTLCKELHQSMIPPGLSRCIEHFLRLLLGWPPKGSSSASPPLLPGQPASVETCSGAQLQPELGAPHCQWLTEQTVSTPSMRSESHLEMQKGGSEMRYKWCDYNKHNLNKLNTAQFH